MTTGYEVDVEFTTPPLRRAHTFIVQTRAEALRLRALGAAKGYRVTSYRPKSIVSADDAIRWLDREVLASNRALNGDATKAELNGEGWVNA